MTKTGIIHAHSKFSYDGEHTLEDLVLLSRRHGFDFIGMTEHSEALDERQMLRFVRECRRLSDSKFVLIPGIEFSCSEDLHILGLGIERLTTSTDPIQVARFIHEQGGLVIVAHPSRARYTIPTGLETSIDGIEIWNARYDGWFVPNDRAIALWRKLQKASRSLIAVGGQDLHAMKPRGHVRMTIPCDELSESGVLRALKDGSFLISNPYLRLRPAALSGWLRLASIAIARRVYFFARTVGKPIRDGFRAVRGAGRTTAKSRPEQGGHGGT